MESGGAVSYILNLGTDYERYFEITREQFHNPILILEWKVKTSSQNA
jgi:hypothetical protein